MSNPIELVDRRLVKEIAELCENFNIGVYATSDPSSRTIFTGEMPPDTLEGIYIVETISPPPHQYVATEYPVFDFWARSPKSGRAHALLDLVFVNFHKRYHYETANWHIDLSRALGNIVDVDRDANNGKLYRLSVQFICRNLNTFS